MEIMRKRNSEPPIDESLRKARKDPKSNIEYEPTKVLFVRGLSVKSTERDIINICSDVGVVTQVFLLKNKGQAFIEFDL